MNSLTLAQIKTIKHRKRQRVSTRRLARDYGVSEYIIAKALTTPLEEVPRTEIPTEEELARLPWPSEMVVSLFRLFMKNLSAQEIFDSISVPERRQAFLERLTKIGYVRPTTFCDEVIDDIVEKGDEGMPFTEIAEHHDAGEEGIARAWRQFHARRAERYLRLIHGNGTSETVRVVRVQKENQQRILLPYLASVYDNDSSETHVIEEHVTSMAGVLNR